MSGRRRREAATSNRRGWKIHGSWRAVGIPAALLVALLPGIAAAAETDNLTYRYVPLEESAGKLNGIVNAALARIAARANARLAAGGDPLRDDDVTVELAFVQEYRAEVLRKFDDRLLPSFGACVERNDCPGWPRFERIVLLGRESIYDESRYDRLAMRSLAPTFRLCGVRIGTDKLTHLFSNGFFAWNAGRQRGSPIRNAEDAFRDAMADERGLMGARSTGVVSRADAEATTAGYRLASSWFEGNDPVFGRSAATGLLVRRREVDVCRFVEPGWDEALDPPVFTAGRRKRARIEAAVAERLAANARGEALPPSEKRRLERELTERVLPAGHGKLPFPDELWVALKWGTAYLTIPRDSRRAIRALAFPKFRREGRRPLRMMRVPGPG
ncbi:MAG TPA: hypothetical protein VFS34_16450 [Thermoanaerobaculia bacterium]|nr:hypothetical protein [Thermoanaerobaculia bacterium]